MQEDCAPCKVCNSTERVPNEINEICANCGAELNSNVDSKVQYTKFGRPLVLGQFVSTRCTFARVTGVPGPHGQNRIPMGTYRQVTLAQGESKIRRMAEQLNIDERCVQKARNLYDVAMTQHGTKGIKSDTTMAALLYIVSRLEKTGHTLIDFAALSNERKPFSLGHLANSICKSLHIHLPNVDPCFYISRFATKMELDNETTKQITIKATRIVQHMKNYGMNVGRKPSGLCGAAILVAATELGIKLDRKKMIDVLRIQKETLRRRMVELRKSTNPSLSLSEYMESCLFKGKIPPLVAGEIMSDNTRNSRLAKMIISELRALGIQNASEDKIYSSELKLFVEANVPDEVDASEAELMYDNMTENDSSSDVVEANIPDEVNVSGMELMYEITTENDLSSDVVEANIPDEVDASEAEVMYDIMTENDSSSDVVEANIPDEVDASEAKLMYDIMTENDSSSDVVEANIPEEVDASEAELMYDITTENDSSSDVVEVNIPDEVDVSEAELMYDIMTENDSPSDVVEANIPEEVDASEAELLYDITSSDVVEANIPDEADASEAELMYDIMTENDSSSDVVEAHDTDDFDVSEAKLMNETENDSFPDKETVDYNSLELPRNLGISLELLGIKQKSSFAPIIDEFAIPLTVDYTMVDLTEINVDDEFCTQNEVKEKLTRYNENFGDFLKERKEKRLAKEKERLAKSSKKTRKSVPASDAVLPENATCVQRISHYWKTQDSVKKSSKVNYDVFKKIQEDIKRVEKAIKSLPAESLSDGSSSDESSTSESSSDDSSTGESSSD